MSSGSSWLTPGHSALKPVLIDSVGGWSLFGCICSTGEEMRSLEEASGRLLQDYWRGDSYQI